MQFAIRQLLLFPNNVANKVRAVDFKAGAVNVITGTSRRGKSAVTHIIDYCLGSGKCSIPVGPVRDTVAWYGLVIEAGGLFLFVARRAPGEQRSTDDYCVVPGPAIAVPRRPEKNANRSGFLSRMNQLAGLANLDLSGGVTKNNYDARASFRDFAAFNFLPQHIVANPQTLFFKADTTEHREKLRRVFPLALGAVDSQYLLAEHEERDLQRRLESLEYELEQRKKAADAWLAELRSFLSRARELGIITDSSLSDDSPADDIIEALRNMLTDATLLALAAPDAGATETAVEQLNAIIREESRIARDIEDRRRQLQRLLELGQSLKDYDVQLRLQYNRVKGVGWLERRLTRHAACPFCGSDSDNARKELRGLVDASKELAEQLDATDQGPPALEREGVRLRAEVRDLEGQLRVRRRERRELEGASTEANEARQRVNEVYRFVGRVEQAVASFDAAAAGGEVARQAEAFRSRLREVRATMRTQNRTARQDAALRLVSRLMEPTAEIMELERRGDVAELLPQELALAFSGTGGRRDYLWEVGSGENWMGYHIAVMLALHEFFMTLPRCPVPTFLVIDQPTQVYFPARDDSYDKRKREPRQDSIGGADPVEASDIQRARRIFQALSEGVKRTKGKLQIIVTEHADELTWGDIESVRRVENWRGPQFLIPSDWINDPTHG